MAEDEGTFEDELDEPLKRAVREMKAAFREAQAPPDLFARTVERIQRLPAPRGRFSTHRWVSWSAPSFVPAFAAIVACLIAVPMITMHDRISRNEQRSKANEIHYNFIKITKKNDEAIKAAIKMSDVNDITFCKPEKATVDSRDTLHLVIPGKEFDNITVNRYKRCSKPETVIYLPEAVVDFLDLDKNNLEKQEIHIYESPRQREESSNTSEL